jgi:putative transposase
LLEDHGLLRERRRGGHARRGEYPVPQLEAKAPNQCWTRSSPLGEGSSDPNLWDITRLPGPARGVFYYLYTIMDIFSREVVGWTVAARESEAIAREVIGRTCKQQGITPEQLTLHADRGTPMTARSMTELLDELGIHKSHSRPRVSNDNPYSETQFKTMKYRPDYPQRFPSIQAARSWEGVLNFVFQ